MDSGLRALRLRVVAAKLQTESFMNLDHILQGVTMLIPKYVLSLLPLIATCLVATFNLFSSTRQKQRLIDRTIRVWNWLDDLQRHSLLNWLRGHAPYIVWIAVFVAICYAVPVIVKVSASNIHILFVLFIVSSGGWLGVRFIRSTLQSHTLLRAVLRATLFLVAVIVILYGHGAFTAYYKDQLIPKDNIVTAFQLIWLIVYFGLYLFVILICLIWMIVALPLILITLSKVLLGALEFILRGTAEHPTGLVALGMVLTALIALTIRIIEPEK